jgi:predicted anti-sigma-YlaC factor YlaD
MTCERCEHWLQEVLDGVEPDGALLEHIAGCPACRDVYESALTLTHALRHLPRPLPAPGLAPRIVSAVLADRQQRRRRRLVWARTGALAAGLLLAFLINYMVQRTDPGLQPATGLLAIRPEPKTSLRQTVADAGSAVVDSARRQVGQAVENTLALLPSIDDLPPMEVESPLDATRLPLQEAGQAVSTGLEPVTGSARRAFTLFLRDLSPGSSRSKTGS